LIQTHKPCAGAETLEHTFGTLNARMGATHFLTKTLGDSSLDLLARPAPPASGVAWMSLAAPIGGDV